MGNGQNIPKLLISKRRLDLCDWLLIIAIAASLLTWPFTKSFANGFIAPAALEMPQWIHAVTSILITYLAMTANGANEGL